MRTSSPDQRFFPFPGSKRPFSQVGYDPLYVEPQRLSRARVESSYPISGPITHAVLIDYLFPIILNRGLPSHQNQSSGGEATLIIFRRESKKLLILETIIYTADIESQFGAKWS
ncbi:hypothetical protein OROGR_029651 [Orobanche gracilis]